LFQTVVSIENINISENVDVSNWKNSY